MPVLPAVAPGPVSFTTSTGNLVSIPLTSIAFNNGQVEGSGALYTANKSVADAVFAHLATIGYLKPGPASPLKPAMVIKAKTTGPHGNFIQVEFFEFDFSTPATPKFKARVNETVTYSGLTPATVQTVLGSATGEPLVFVPGAAPTTMPKAGSYPLVVTPPATSAAVDIPKRTGTGNAFSVQARDAGADGALTTVDITAVDTTANTFTLIASWKKETSTAVPASGLAAVFAYEIEITPPEGATAVSTPAPGVFTLSGGSEVSEARKASAIIGG